MLLSPVGSTPGAPVTWSRPDWAPVLMIRPSAIHGGVTSPDVDSSGKLRPAVALLPVRSLPVPCQALGRRGHDLPAAAWRVAVPGLAARPPPPETPQGSLLTEGPAVVGAPERGVHSAALCLVHSLPCLGPGRQAPPRGSPVGGGQAARCPGQRRVPGLELGRRLCSPTSSRGPALPPICLARGASPSQPGPAWGSRPPRPRGAGPAGLGGWGGDHSQGGLASPPACRFSSACRRERWCLFTASDSGSLSVALPTPEAQAPGEVLCPGPPWRCGCSPVSSFPGALGCGSSLTPLGEAPAAAFLTLSFLVRSCAVLSGQNHPPPRSGFICGIGVDGGPVTPGLWAAAVPVWVLSSSHFYLGALQREVSLLPRERLSGTWVLGPFYPRPARLLLRSGGVGAGHAGTVAGLFPGPIAVRKWVSARTHTHSHSRMCTRSAGLEALPGTAHPAARRPSPGGLRRVRAPGELPLEGAVGQVGAGGPRRLSVCGDVPGSAPGGWFRGRAPGGGRGRSAAIPRPRAAPVLSRRCCWRRGEGRDRSFRKPRV